MNVARPTGIGGNGLYENLWITLVDPNGKVNDIHYGNPDHPRYLKVEVSENSDVEEVMIEVELIAAGVVWKGSAVIVDQRVDAIHRILHHLKKLGLVTAASI